MKLCPFPYAYLAIGYSLLMASLVVQSVKHLPAMWETRVWFLGQEDPLEKEMAIHSSTLAWKIPWTEEPDRLQSMGSQRVGHDWATSLSFFLSFAIGLPAFSFDLKKFFLYTLDMSPLSDLLICIVNIYLLAFFSLLLVYCDKMA